MKLATLCYIEKDGKTLMMLRNRKQGDIHKGKYNGLGGKLEPGESPDECVVREVFEESGLTIEPLFRGIITFPLFTPGDDWYVFVYTADDFTGEQIDSPEGTLEWVPTESLLELNLWEGDRHFLQWLRDGKKFSAKITYIEKELKDVQVSFWN